LFIPAIIAFYNWEYRVILRIGLEIELYDLPVEYSWKFAGAVITNLVKPRPVLQKVNSNNYFWLFSMPVIILGCGQASLSLVKRYKIIVCLFIHSFTSGSRMFYLYGDVTIAGKGLQNLGRCSVLKTFEQGGIFVVPHLLWNGTSVFPVSSEGPPHSVAFYYMQEDAEDLYWPGSSRVQNLGLCSALRTLEHLGIFGFSSLIRRTTPI
jgi:hypothetical protein